jgi:hypothetical protein
VKSDGTFRPPPAEERSDPAPFRDLAEYLVTEPFDIQARDVRERDWLAET